MRRRGVRPLLLLLLVAAAASLSALADPEAAAATTVDKPAAASASASMLEPPGHPFLRHRPMALAVDGLDPNDGSGGGKGRLKLMDGLGGKQQPTEHEVVVPPAPQDETTAPPPACPRNARFSFCATDPGCAPTCEDHIAPNGARVAKPCNRMCYQRCECLPDHLLLEGFCVPQAACDKVKDARTPNKKRHAIEEALEGFDPIKDRLVSDNNNNNNHHPRPPKPTGNGGNGGGGGPGIFDDVIAEDGLLDDVNDMLDSVTGGLWPTGGPGSQQQQQQQQQQLRQHGRIQVGPGRVAVDVGGGLQPLAVPAAADEEEDGVVEETVPEDKEAADFTKEEAAAAGGGH